MALEISGWKTFSPCLIEYALKSCKVTGVSAVDIMDVVIWFVYAFLTCGSVAVIALESS